MNAGSNLHSAGTHLPGDTEGRAGTVDVLLVVFPTSSVFDDGFA